jgi:hypothetical protein
MMDEKLEGNTGKQKKIQKGKKISWNEKIDTVLRLP